MRFTIRTLLAATAAISLVLCVFFVFPNWLAVAALSLSVILLPVVAVSVAVFGRGYWRALGVGATVVAGCWPIVTSYIMLMLLMAYNLEDMSDYLSFVSDDSDIRGMKIGFVVNYSLVAMGAMTSVGIRWLAVRPQSSLARDALVELERIRREGH